MTSLAGEKVPTFSTTATPTSACLSAPASFNPSPTIITLRPAACSSRMMLSLSNGL